MNLTIENINWENVTFEGAPASVPYVANDGPLFDGTNDFIRRTDAFASNGKAGTFSTWFKVIGNDTNFHIWYELDTNFNVSIRRNSTKDIFVGLKNTANVDILVMDSTSTFATGGGWHHFIASWDLAATTAQMYIDDVDEANITVGPTDDTIDYAQTGQTIGARSDSSLFVNGSLQEFWLTDTFIDLSVTANRRKWYSAAGKPVDLGSDGSTPTGTQPIHYLKNSFGTFENNLGSGGNFTVTGALTDEGTSPSD